MASYQNVELLKIWSLGFGSVFSISAHFVRLFTLRHEGCEGRWGGNKKLNIQCSTLFHCCEKAVDEQIMDNECTRCIFLCAVLIHVIWGCHRIVGSSAVHSKEM